MITDAEVMRLFERADPARLDDVASVIDVSSDLDALRTRSYVTMVELTPTPTAPTSRRRLWILTAVAASIVLLVGSGLLLAAGDDATEPVPDEISVATDSAEDAASAGPEGVATGFIAAYGAFDLERATAHLADDADISRLMTSVGVADADGTLEEFRLLLLLLEAQGYKQIFDASRSDLPGPRGCDEVDSSSSGVRLRCPFHFHLLHSEEIGLGSFSGSYFDLTVRDREIVRASQHWEVGEFSPQMWEPFAEWVSRDYPNDAEVMYADQTHSGPRLTEESIRLWEQRSGQYAAAGVSYIARARDICEAAVRRVGEAQRAGEERASEFYDESWGRILGEALTELRAIPPPHAVRAQFDQAYALVEQLAESMIRSDTEASSNFIDVLHELEGLPGMRACTFYGPR